MIDYVIELVNPDAIIPVHTDNPERLEELSAS